VYPDGRQVPNGWLLCLVCPFLKVLPDIKLHEVVMRPQLSDVSAFSFKERNETQKPMRIELLTSGRGLPVGPSFTYSAVNQGILGCLCILAVKPVRYYSLRDPAHYRNGEKYLDSRLILLTRGSGLSLSFLPCIGEH
jgi:hypothetical protein